MGSLSEKKLFEILVDFDKAALHPSQPKLQLSAICLKVKSELKTDVLLDEQVAVIDNLIRKYRTLKQKFKKKYGYGYIIENASDEIILTNSTYKEEEKGPSSTKKLKSAHEEKPAHRPRARLEDLGDRRQKERTEEIVCMIIEYIKREFPELTFNQVLGYLIFRENRQGDKAVADVGMKLFKQCFDKPNGAFTIDEAIAFKHNLTLSREQIRKTRYVLQNKNVYFPTSNELNDARKKLRPVVETTLSDKGVKVDYTALVEMTTESILKTVIEECKFEPKPGDNYKIFFKDGCDGAGQQTTMKSKDMVNSKHHMFQYGLVPLRTLCIRATKEEEVMWINESPNSQLSVRPVYLIREEETNQELIEEVIKTTDKARDELNEEGMVVNYGDMKVDMSFDIKDTMKDLKLKRNISGMKGARCILCETKQNDWTSAEKVAEGFPITRTVAEAKLIYGMLAD